MGELPGIIDVYAHCGVSHYKPVADVLDAMDHAGVGRAVLVQHLGEFDNTYIQQIVEQHPERFIGVCLVDHTALDPIGTLDRWLDTGVFRGLRVQLQHLGEARPLYEAAVERDLNIVLCTIGGLDEYLVELRAFLETHPSCSLTLTHWGWPRAVDAPGFRPYRDVLTLAEFPCVYLQLSGLDMFAPNAPAVFAPVAELAYEAFGSDRLVWGSNFPVSGGDTPGYVSELAQYQTGTIPLPGDALPKILHDTAARLWGFQGS